MKRTPLVRKTPMKRRAKRRYVRPAEVARADRMAAEIVHARGRCAVQEHPDGFPVGPCGGRLEQHHARGRGLGFRWRTESHLLLCACHHRTGPFSAHGSPKAFRQWLEIHHPEIANMPNHPEAAAQAVGRLREAP